MADWLDDFTTCFYRCENHDCWMSMYTFTGEGRGYEPSDHIVQCESCGNDMEPYQIDKQD